MTTDVPEQLSLRERKKLRAMRHIQGVSLDLFDEHGYDAVTIERIAAEAEVSPSSVYRYFGTKERLILHDEWDPALFEMIEQKFGSHGLVEAMRQSVEALLPSMGPDEERRVRRRMRYVMDEPAVRAGMLRDVDEMNDLTAQMIARHTGRDPADLDIRVAVGALISGLIAAIYYWNEHPGSRLVDVLHETVDLMENGFDLNGG